MRKFLLFLGVFFMGAHSICAQTPTLVSGTITDTNGVPYSFANVSAQLIPSTATPTIIVNGIPTQIGGQQNGAADVNGTFIMNLFCNTAGGGCSVISPAATTWQITVNETGTPPPLGTGPQFCTATLTITGASQSVTASFSACPALGRSSGGPVSGAINVKTLGAKGDTQAIISPTIGTPGGNDVTCTQCGFAATDIGKTFFVNSQTNGCFPIGQSTITNVVSSTRITLASLVGGCGGPALAVWGTIDDAAFATANTQLGAAIKAGSSQNGGNAGVISSPATVYIPSGAYLLCNKPTGVFNLNTANLSGWSIIGDGRDQTLIYLCQTPTLPGNNAFWNVQINTFNGRMEHFTINGNFGPQSGGTSGIATGANIVNDVVVNAWGSSTGCTSQVAFSVGSTSKITNSEAEASCAGFSVNGTNIEIDHSISSNNAGYNLKITNSPGGGTGGGGAGVRWDHGLIDECANADPTQGPACLVVQNSQDVYIANTGIFSSTGAALAYAADVDGTSVVHFVSDVLGQFSSGGGLNIHNGGMAQATDTRFFGAPTGANKCINTNSAGIFKNLGGNTCTDTGATIAAVGVPGLTEAGNVVTVTTTAAHGMAVGSSNEIVWITGGVGVTGYKGNWFVASVPSTTTFTYVNPTAGLANSGGGVAVTDQPSFFAGTLGPQAGITHSANTFELPAVIAAVNFGNQTPDQAIIITKIQGIDTNGNTTCAVAPVVTFTQGATTATLTLTTGKAAWDSAVDASTGLPMQLVPGIVFTASTTAGTCAVPPTNLAVTYTWQSRFQP